MKKLFLRPRKSNEIIHNFLKPTFMTLLNYLEQLIDERKQELIQQDSNWTVKNWTDLDTMFVGNAFLKEMKLGHNELGSVANKITEILNRPATWERTEQGDTDEVMIAKLKRLSELKKQK